MFATINTITQPENFWGKIKYNLLPPPVKSEIISVEEGSDFLRLTVPIVRGKIYWNNVRSAAGAGCAQVITQNGVRVSDGVHLKTFQSERFLSLLTVNSFFKLLRLLPHHKLLSECAVIDISGTLAPMLGDLPRYCRTVKIITANAAKYESFCARCLEKYGCAVCVSDNLSKAFFSPLVLMPKPPTHATAFSNSALVFSSSEKNLYTSRLLIPEGVSLPAKYLSLMPKGINPVTFAAALYEISGITSLSDCVSPAFRENNLILSYKEVFSMLDY